jgi:hypothetical protein
MKRPCPAIVDGFAKALKSQPPPSASSADRIAALKAAGLQRNSHWLAGSGACSWGASCGSKRRVNVFLPANCTPHVATPKQ